MPTNNLMFLKSIILAACLSFAASPFAYSKDEARDDFSFTAQCPKLLAVADDFAKECLEKARIWSYEAIADVALNKIIVSQTVYFRQTDPKSHFSLGCVLRNNDRKKVDYIGVYYTANGNNFNIPDNAKLTGYDGYGGINFNVNGKPIYFVFVRPFVTKSLPFSDEDSGMQYSHWLKRDDKPKNCEDVAIPNGATISKDTFIKRTDNNGKITIKTCEYPLCKPTPNEEKHPPVTDYVKFFGDDDQQIIYGSFASNFFIESGGGLLIRNDILQMNCRFSAWITKFLFGFHDSGIVPQIETEACNLTPSAN